MINRKLTNHNSVIVLVYNWSSSLFFSNLTKCEILLCRLTLSHALFAIVNIMIHKTMCTVQCERLSTFLISSNLTSILTASTF